MSKVSHLPQQRLVRYTDGHFLCRLLLTCIHELADPHIEIHVRLKTQRREPELVFYDNGRGMSPEGLAKCLQLSSTTSGPVPDLPRSEASDSAPVARTRQHMAGCCRLDLLLSCPFAGHKGLPLLSAMLNPSLNRYGRGTVSLTALGGLIIVESKQVSELGGVHHTVCYGPVH
jgi:hypothetical protein